VNLVLFDIDGTLLHAGGAGARAYGKAIEHVLGWPAEICAKIHFAGNTDLRVLYELADVHAPLPVGFNPHAFFAEMANIMRVEMEREQVIALPGAIDLVHQLARKEGVLLGLLTGNAEVCAAVKLAAIGLQGHFKFGGFGCEHPDRNELARRALDRAKQHAASPIQKIYVIGDTPRDIAAAHAIGALAIGVTTGPYDATALHHAGTSHVVASLNDFAFP